MKLALIAVLSDTHIPARARSLPEQVVRRLKGADLILHAGDFTTMETLTHLRALAPTEAVYGNVDDPLLKTTLPRTRIVEVGGFRIGLIHGDGPGLSTLERARGAFRGVDCIVFGHSHMPYLGSHGPVLMLNPGSPTDRRSAPRPSFALLEATDHLRPQIVYL